MFTMQSLLPLFLVVGIVVAGGCPFMNGEHSKRDNASTESIESTSEATAEFLAQFELNDTHTGYMTTDWGTPINDQVSLKAGRRGPTLLEDFAFRQKLQRFDHERIPERVVHARGTGAHGVFTSYGNYTNITAASFLAEEGKQTPMFVRFSTVVGERGSSDTARDVHGMATRFYTDQGNLDIVGINLPIFFVNDAMLFPDMIHAFKPEPNNQIPQAATAHNTAYDFFGSQPSTLNIVMLLMAGFGLPRSYRHMDGFGVHTFRMVTDDGSSKLIRWHWKSKQGRASLLWEEAQVVGGKNPDFHRQDLHDAIENEIYPEWELGVQIMDEDQQTAFGFDVLDPTKFIPEELVPVTIIGKMTLNRNTVNYFAETEQVGFQPGHVVRGIDFSDDPLLQGRLYSYLDTQMNRYGGPNFEQAPINRPRIPIHNNNRDGKAQAYIPTNNYAYSPNALNNGFPKQATQSEGKGFFTAPKRTVSGHLVRELSPTFANHYSQPHMIWNSLSAAERQVLVNSLRFEISKVTSQPVRQTFINALNRVSHALAVRVAAVLSDVTVPAEDTTYYTNATTSSLHTFSDLTLPTIRGLGVGILTSTSNTSALTQAASLRSSFASLGLTVTVVAESQTPDVVTATYSATDATAFDAIVVAEGAQHLFFSTNTNSNSNSSLAASSPLYPLNRPLQILSDAFAYGKTVAAVGEAGRAVLSYAGCGRGEGVVYAEDEEELVSGVREGLRAWRFLARFPLDA